MSYYEQSFQRLYENFVFSLKIYPDRHYQEVLCYQVLEKNGQVVSRLPKTRLANSSISPMEKSLQI